MGDLLGVGVMRKALDQQNIEGQDRVVIWAVWGTLRLVLAAGVVFAIVVMAGGF